ALEHHVLQEVGDAAVAGRLVAGASAVVEDRGDERRLVVLDQADREAVAQPLAAHPAGQGEGADVRGAVAAAAGGGGATPPPPARLTSIGWRSRSAPSLTSTARSRRS